MPLLARLRRVAAVATVLAATAATVVPAAEARRARSVVARQDLAALRVSHTLHATPGTRASSGRIPAWGPITGGQTVLPVVARTTTANGVRWLRVRVPGRPNGRKAWIRQRGTTLATTSWHVVVEISKRRVLAYRGGRLVRSFSAIVGAPATPTPHGRFFVEESVEMLPGSAGAPYALALSARSNVLQEFAGGPGQIAVHGVGNVGGTLGTAASHGCVRLADADIRWLAGHIAPGVPVTLEP